MNISNGMRRSAKQIELSQFGKYKLAPRKSPIKICSCGNRYIKTRIGQIECHRCIRVKERVEEDRQYHETIQS